MLSFAALCYMVLRAASIKHAFIYASLASQVFAQSLYWLYISMHEHGQMPSIMAALAVLLFALYLTLPAETAAIIGTYFWRHYRDRGVKEGQSNET